MNKGSNSPEAASAPKRKPWGLLLAVFLLGATLLFGAPWLKVAAARETENKEAAWTFLTGYGTSHPGMGETRTRVRTIDLVTRYERKLSHDLGSSWYRGDHSLLLELPLHLMVHPELAPMAGINFLACWTFTTSEQWQPYFFAGGGPLYIATDIEGMGTRVNGNYQFGGGLSYRLGDGRDLKFEYRFHHVSNGNRVQPNEPLNSSKFLLGITF